MESEPTVSWAFVELLDATHQNALKEQKDANKQTVKVLWRVIVGLLIIIVIMGIIIGYGIWLWNQYDTISYDQDGNGNNIIGDENRSYYYEPEDESTSEEEQE